MPEHTNENRKKALRDQGCLHPHPDAVGDPLFEEDTFFDRNDVVQVKYEMLRRARIEKETVGIVAALYGFSRVSFYQALKAFRASGLTGLLPQQRGPRRRHKLNEEIVSVLRKRIAVDPSVGAAALARLVEEKFGRKVHVRSVERALGGKKKKRR